MKTEFTFERNGVPATLSFTLPKDYNKPIIDELRSITEALRSGELQTLHNVIGIGCEELPVTVYIIPPRNPKSGWVECFDLCSLVHELVPFPVIANIIELLYCDSEDGILPR